MQEAEIKKEIARWAATVSDIDAAVSASSAKLQEIEAERTRLLLPSRTGDKEAQGALSRIDKEIEQLARQARDDKEALSQAQQKVEQLRAQLAVAERERERQRVRQAVQARLDAKLERRAAELVRDLDAVLDEIRRGNSRLGVEMSMFDPSLESAARLVSDTVRAIDPPPVHYGNARRGEALSEFSRAAELRLRRAVEAIDAVATS
jgi:ParB-like chromosome segregation protein Spo0J